MSEWDGPRIRELFHANTRGVLELMEQVNRDQAIEIQMLVVRIRDLVLASMDPSNPAGLRGPLNALVNVMAAHAPAFITDPYVYQMYLFGCVFAIAAMNVVDHLEQLATPKAANCDFENLMGKSVTFPTGPAPSILQNHTGTFPTGPAPSILQNPTGELALENEDVKSIRMSAKRKLVFTQQETHTSPKRELLIPKEEDSPIVIVPKRRSARKSGVDAVGESVANLPRFHSVEVKVEVVDDNIEKKKCDHCDLKVGVSEMEQLKHTWKKHKNLVYKYIRPELVCTIDYCDYVSSSVHGRRIHEGRTHGIKPLVQRRVVSELKASKCPYCAVEIDSIVSLKKHVLQCTERDECPMLGCSACPNQSFHFIYDFTAHLKKFGGVTHGKPTLLNNE